MRVRQQQITRLCARDQEIGLRCRGAHVRKQLAEPDEICLMA